MQWINFAVAEKMFCRRRATRKTPQKWTGHTPAKLKRDIARLEAPLQKVELYVEAKLVKTFLGGDLDDARIYAAARPAFAFFIEQWAPGDSEGGNRELLHSEFYVESARRDS